MATLEAAKMRQRLPYTPVFEDATLPHQIILRARNAMLTVSCNCLPAGETIAERMQWEPGEARKLWHDWHEEAIGRD
jgi:hypothetical protein